MRRRHHWSNASRRRRILWLYSTCLHRTSKLGIYTRCTVWSWSASWGWSAKYCDPEPSFKYIQVSSILLPLSDSLPPAVIRHLFNSNSFETLTGGICFTECHYSYFYFRFTPFLKKEVVVWARCTEIGCVKNDLKAVDSFQLNFLIGWNMIWTRSKLIRILYTDSSWLLCFCQRHALLANTLLHDRSINSYTKQ